MKNVRDVAVTVQNMVQFYNVNKGLEELLGRGITVDIYIPKGYDNNGMEEMFEDTYNAIKDRGYNIFRTIQDVEYKVLLEPYPMEYYFKFKYQYRVKYSYVSLCTKPDLVYFPDNYLCYDGVISYGPYEADYLQAYVPTHMIGNMLFHNFCKSEKTKNSDKPVLLYLPTYGKDSSLELVVECIDELKEKYHVITKFHHGTSFLKDEQERLTQFEKKCDECYNHNILVADLLKKADVVLSDNSGAIFDAIYAEVPVCIATKMINEGLEEFSSPQYDLVQKGIIPYTDKASDIIKIVEQCGDSDIINKQKGIRKHYFYISESMPQEFADVIELYLNDKINLKKKQLHTILDRRYKHYKYMTEQFYLLQQEFENYKVQCDSEQKSLKRQVSYYENGKLYILAKMIYKVWFKLLRKE